MTNPNDRIHPITPREDHKISLTKREYFAAMAMQGIIYWDATVNGPHDGGKLEQLACQSVHMADALIAALSKKSI